MWDSVNMYVEDRVAPEKLDTFARVPQSLNKGDN